MNQRDSILTHMILIQVVPLVFQFSVMNNSCMAISVNPHFHGSTACIGNMLLSFILVIVRTNPSYDNLTM
ncbi:hypothetical protein EV361DRAFT_908510 [Lentinula raphanica]|nr:hypothetical protein EV361DRAFT_908510 [Lentinula raphanica]